MFVLSKGSPQIFNPIKDRKNKHLIKTGTNMKREKNGSKTYRKEFQPTEDGKRYNIWTYNIGGESDNNHPAIFPEKLARDHIISWSNEGDIVLDPMCGSGTTCKMAKMNGRNFIGIEISPEYCKIAEDRLRQEVLF